MQAIIDNYFESVRLHALNADVIDGNMTDEELAIFHLQPYSRPTVTGLALALDLTRQGLLEYEEKGEFSDTVKKAKARVEQFIEDRLFENAPAGAIFNLKNNFGWKDKTEVEQSGKVKGDWTVTYKNPEKQEE